MHDEFKYYLIIILFYILFCHSWLLELAAKIDQHQSLIMTEEPIKFFVLYLEKIGIPNLCEPIIHLWKSVISNLHV